MWISSVSLAFAAAIVGSMIAAPSPDAVEVVHPAAGPDFDADGYADLAVGTPGECLHCVALPTGVVHVTYGSDTGADLGRQWWLWPGLDGLAGNWFEGGEFGRVLAWGDFDGDGFDDLAASAPEERVSGQLGAGAVSVVYGSRHGLDPAGSERWSLGGRALVGHADAGDLFGTGLAVGDFNADDRDDLAVLVGDGGTRGDGPSVRVIYGSDTGLTATGAERRRRTHGHDVRTYRLAAGDFDRDGADDLVLGQSAARGARGSVKVYSGSADGLAAHAGQSWSRTTDGVDGDARPEEYFGSSVATGDVNGDGFADLAVGVQRDRDRPDAQAGALHVLFGSGSGLTTAGNELVALGDLEPPDFAFGGLAAVEIADADGDGDDDLALGHPDAFADDDDGAVAVLSGSPRGVLESTLRIWRQGDLGTGGLRFQTDGFGRAVSWSDLDGDGLPELVISAPYEDFYDDSYITHYDAGLVHIMAGSEDGPSPVGAGRIEPRDLGVGEPYQYEESLRLGMDLS